MLTPLKLTVISIFTAAAVVHSLPLNFRFSPRFDFISRQISEGRTEERTRHLGHQPQRPEKQGVKPHKSRTLKDAKVNIRRRFPRSAPQDGALGKLKKRLAALKQELSQRKIQARDSDAKTDKVQFDKEDEDENDHVREEMGKIDWAAKLHNKHIFHRQTEILGTFPKKFPELPVIQEDVKNPKAARGIFTSIAKKKPENKATGKQPKESKKVRISPKGNPATAQRAENAPKAGIVEEVEIFDQPHAHVAANVGEHSPKNFRLILKK